MATTRASTHGDSASLPINLGIVLLQPGKSKNDIMSAYRSDCEYCSLGVALVPNNQVDNLFDAATSVRGPIDIVDWDWPRKSSSCKSMFVNKPLVYEQARGSTVNQGRTGLDFGSVSGLQFDFDVQRGRTGCRSKGIMLGELTLPFWSCSGSDSGSGSAGA